MLLAHARHARSWLPMYLAGRLRGRACAPKRVWLAIADHFEPFWRRADEDQARARVTFWLQNWPRVAERYRDARGHPPKYTFFYPEEQYKPWHLDALGVMANAGIADVEVHIHHDGEGEQNFKDRISTFTEQLFHAHGLLRKLDGAIAFGFVHGNWALDNSRSDGRWCGLNNEITLLRQLGCYADFTLPSVPSDCQTRMVNTIYWATDDPEKPKSHDLGIPVTPGSPFVGDLMLIPGPLGIYRDERRFLPRIETGELASHHPVTLKRIQTWLKVAPQIGEDIFIKLFAHGGNESNGKALLSTELDFVFSQLNAECARRGLDLYYASAFEMWTAVEALRTLKDPVRAAGAVQSHSKERHFTEK